MHRRMMTSSRKKQLIFVYGTLQRNEPNHHWIAEKKTRFHFMGNAKTVRKFPLVIATEYNIPYLLDKPEAGNQICGELYQADHEMLDHLDILEDYPKHYARRQEPVYLEGDEEKKLAWIYVLQNFNESLLKLPQLYKYSSSDSHGRPYRSRAEREGPLDYEKLH